MLNLNIRGPIGNFLPALCGSARSRLGYDANNPTMNVSLLLQKLRCVLAGWVGAMACIDGQAAHADDAQKADSTGVWQMSISPYTDHFRHSADHRSVWAIGLERELADHSLYGAFGFSNSFGQPSAYVYYGWVFPKIFPAVPALYLKVTAGLLYGYMSPFNDKVPLNYNGFSPAIIPALGWQFDEKWSGQVNLLGTAAVMFMVNRKF